MKKYKKFRIIALWGVIISIMFITSSKSFSFMSNENVNIPTINRLNKSKVNIIKQFDKSKLIKSNLSSLQEEYDIYSDEKGNLVYYDEGENVVGYAVENSSEYIENNTMNVQSLNERNVLDIANDYYNEIVDTNDYVYYTNYYTQDTGIYTVLYYKMLGGYRTSDVLFIQINNNQELVGYGCPMQNLFTEYTFDQDNVNVNKIEQYVEKEITSRYGLSSYRITDYMFDICNNELCMKVSYTINLGDAEYGDIVYVPVNEFMDID